MRVVTLPIHYQNKKEIKECRLNLIDSEELCVIEISLGSQVVKYEAESFFQALIEIRLDLEKMAEYAPGTIVLSESALADDSALSNAHYILMNRGIELKLI